MATISFSCLVLAIVLYQVDLSVSFNLESRLPVIKRGRDGTYFGYSVAEHQSIAEVTKEVQNNW